MTKRRIKPTTKWEQISPSFEQPYYDDNVQRQLNNLHISITALSHRNRSYMWNKCFSCENWFLNLNIGILLNTRLRVPSNWYLKSQCTVGRFCMRNNLFTKRTKILGFSCEFIPNHFSMFIFCWNCSSPEYANRICHWAPSKK